MSTNEPDEYSDDAELQPIQRVRQALGSTTRTREHETQREVEETREVVYGPDGQTPEAERQRRRVTIQRDPHPGALSLLMIWIGRLLMGCVVGFSAIAVGISLAKYEAPLWTWITPLLAALVVAPLLADAWRGGSSG